MCAAHRMRRGVLFLVVLSLAFGLPAAAHAQTSFFKSKSESKTGGKGESQDPMTREEFQFAITAFVDSFGARMFEAATELENQAMTSEARLAASRMKYASLASAIEIACAPHPGPALLDLVVLTTLTRMLWEEYWRPQVFGPSADAMVAVLKKLEADIWSLCGKLLTPEQQGDLRDLIRQWRDENPDKKYVNFIRFSDFGAQLGRKPHLEKVTKPGGLLAPVSEAAQKVEDIRGTIERFMYLHSRLLMITGFQVEMVYQELVNKPEVKELLSHAAGLREISERYADLLANFPARMAEVGTDTVNKTMKHVSVQTDRTINQIAQKLSTEREAAIAQALKGLSLEREMMIEQLKGVLAVERSAALSQALQGISQEREEILKAGARLMIGSEAVAEQWMNQAFFLGLVFILLILLAMLLYRFATKGPVGFRGIAVTIAVFLAVLAAMAYWKYGLQTQSPVQILQSSHRSDPNRENLPIRDRSAPPSGENRANPKISYGD